MEMFPQIMPLNSSGTEFVGYLTSLNEEFYIHLYINENSSPRSIQLRGSKELNEILKPVIATLEQQLIQSSCVTDMLSEIQNCLDQQIRINNFTKTSVPHIDCTLLLGQLQECGLESVHFINPNFQEVHLKTTDDFDRDHILKMWLPEKFPTEGPKFECDLPEEFSYKWLPGDTLKEMLTVFREKVHSFHEFWINVEELDRKTWILEPEIPQRKDCKRRIGLASALSLLIIINPETPTAVPTCHFLGPERLVETVRGKFNKNIHLWSECNSVFYNLQEVLEMQFPSPSTNEKEEFCMDCGICYSYLLEDVAPELTCDNSNCNQPFHRACLYEYIRMLPDVKSSFNKLFGHCPYCSKPLWCNIP